MLIKSICNPEAVSCGATTTVVEAAALMRKHHVGDLVVVGEPTRDQVPLGVVTDRDLVVEVLGLGLDPATTRVGAIVRKPVVVAHDNEEVPQVIERMKTHGVRRIPVVDRGGALAGIITLDDLLGLVAADLAALAGLVAQQSGRERRARR
ncbi:MAG TPA: CBS domain-containing protein [Burkholderiaceae bacterium]|nr:CBS domain-containing protein [Burkholderiaceae bacterium]